MNNIYCANKALISLIAPLWLYSCSFDARCNILEENIEKTCIIVHKPYLIEVSKLVQFKWDELYIIDGPMLGDEIEEIIGIKYGDVIQDDETKYIFVSNGYINKVISSDCDELIFSDDLSKGKGYIKFLPSTSITAEKHITDGISSYYIK